MAEASLFELIALACNEQVVVKLVRCHSQMLYCAVCGGGVDLLKSSFCELFYLDEVYFQ